MKLSEIKDLNQKAAVVHEANKKWWQNIDTGERIERDEFELLSLVISEVSECLEGERKNLMDDKLPHRKMAEVEMADAYIRLLDFAGGFNYRIIPAIFDAPIQPTDNRGAALFFLTKLVIDIGDEGEPDEPVGFSIGLALKWIEGYCTAYGYDLWGAIDEKMEYNRTRHDHSHEARKSAGGKQF